MQASIFPETWGDVIVALRYEPEGGGVTLVEVHSDGSEKGAFPKLAQIRDGGGHLDLFGFVIDEAANFSRNDDQTIKVSY